MYKGIPENFDKNIFSAEWLLLDIETDGFDADKDNIILIRLAYMENYKILNHKSLFIKLTRPIGNGIKKLIGISENDFEQAVSLESALTEIEQLSNGVPVLTTEFTDRFLKNAFIKNERSYKLQCILIDKLMKELCENVKGEKISKLIKELPDPIPDVPHLNDVQMDTLYRRTVSVFKRMEEKYEG